MKAMILVAGLGTRLRPLTNTVPKCMVQLAGKPVLLHTIEWCRDSGIREFVLNPCHLREVVTSFFGDGRRFGVQIHYSFEESPLGTAGGVKQAARFFTEPFLVFPSLLNRGAGLYGHRLTEQERLWAIDRPQDLARAERELEQMRIADCGLRNQSGGLSLESKVQSQLDWGGAGNAEGRRKNVECRSGNVKRET